MKKIFILIHLLISVIFSYAISEIDKEVLYLNSVGCEKIIYFNNDCFFFNYEALSPYVGFANSYHFLFYQKENLSYVTVFYLKKISNNKRIYKKKTYSNFYYDSLWIFHDTCNVSVFDSILDVFIDDGCDAVITYYVGANISKKFYFNTEWYYSYSNSPYYLFLINISERVKDFLFSSSRFDLKKIYGKRGYNRIIKNNYENKGIMDIF